jgi:hypothetical protein
MIGAGEMSLNSEAKRLKLNGEQMNWMLKSTCFQQTSPELYLYYFNWLSQNSKGNNRSARASGGEPHG